MPGLQALQRHQHKGEKCVNPCSWISSQVSRKGNCMIKDILGAILGTLAFVAIWILAACLWKIMFDNVWQMNHLKSVWNTYRLLTWLRQESKRPSQADVWNCNADNGFFVATVNPRALSDWLRGKRYGQSILHQIKDPGSRRFVHSKTENNSTGKFSL